MKKVLVFTLCLFLVFGTVPTYAQETVKSSLPAQKNSASVNSSDLIYYGDFGIDENGVLWSYIGTDVDMVIPGDIGIVAIGDNTFSSFNNCSFQSIVIPEGVLDIGDAVFYYCSDLTSITLPNSMTSIGAEAFYACSSLTNICLPGNLTSIGNKSFYSCSALTSVTIPDSVTNIGAFAFAGCESLTGFTLTAGNMNYSSKDGVLFNKEQTKLIQYPVGKSGSSYIIPDSVTSIEDTAFDSCVTLTSVTMPDSVTSIGDYAFANCDNLTIDSFGRNVTNIGDYAFYACNALTSVSLPDSVTSIGKSAFCSCDALTSVSMSDGVTSIGESAFTWCENLSSFTVTAGNMTYSGKDGVLFNKDQTKLIQYPQKKAGNYIIPDSVTSIGDEAFLCCTSLLGITMPDSVTSIGDCAFSTCTALTSLTIPDSITSIGTHTFSDCDALTRLSISDSVTSIGDSAFKGCSGLTSLSIPLYVTSIGNSAFRYCSGLVSVFIQNNVTSIGDYAFAQCESLSVFFVATGNMNYSSLDGVLFNKDQTKLIQYPPRNFSSYTIPDSVTSIGDYAFYDCDDLTSINMPDSITSIGFKAFYSCDNLIIFGVSGSYAQTYAEDSGIPFVPSTPGLYMVTAPTKTTYVLGDALDLSGLSLTFVATDGTVTTVDIDDCIVSGFNADQSGTQTVEIVYNEATVTFEVKVLEVLYPESNHPYDNDMDKTWSYSHPQPADYLSVVFSQETFVEASYDTIYLYDGEGTLLGTYTGDELAGQTIQVSGNTFSITLTSDVSFTEYGFSIDSIVGHTNNIIMPAEGSDCVVDKDQGYIYGLTAGVTKPQFEESIQVSDNDTIEYSTEPFGTGTEVYVIETGTVIVTFTIIIYGDVNGDGSIDSIDSGNIVDSENYVVTWDPVADAATIKAADLNGDGSVDSIDAGIAVDAENYIVSIDQTTGLVTPV